MKRIWTALSAVAITCGVVYAGSLDIYTPDDSDLVNSADVEVIKILGYCDTKDNYTPCMDFKMCYGEGCVCDFYNSHRKIQVKKCLKAKGGNTCHAKGYEL